MRDLSSIRIAFIAGTLGQGGAERQLYYIVSALQDAGASVHVLCLTAGEFWEARLRSRGVPVTWVGRHPSRARRLLDILAVLLRCAPDLVQSHHFYTNLYASLAARALARCDLGAVRSDVVSEIHDSGRVLGPLSLRLPRLVVANSRLGIANAVRHGVPAHRVHLLANVVDERHFRPPPASDRPEGRATLLAIGRLGPEKRLDRFLRVVAAARPVYPGRLRALIVGDGPERLALERQARALDLLPGVVEFRGPAADTAPLYRESDVLVLASAYEGTPNVVLEAMASGLPVVATEVGGVADLVDDGQTGFLAAPDDESALCRAVLRLLSCRDLRLAMGARGRERVVDRHSLDRLPRRLAGLYEAALS